MELPSVVSYKSRVGRLPDPFAYLTEEIINSEWLRRPVKHGYVAHSPCSWMGHNIAFIIAQQHLRDTRFMAKSANFPPLLAFVGQNSIPRVARINL